MLPTVGELLELPEIRRGNPVVLAGGCKLDRPVRWVHVSELADIGDMLTGGEALLTTGVVLPHSTAGLTQYVNSLVDAGVAALFLGLGRGFEHCPQSLIQAAESASLPLIELRSTIRFITVTEAVHSLIVNRQMVELRRTQRTHEVFTNLGLEGASVPTILKEAATLAQSPVILENLSHLVLAHDSNGRFDEDVLHDWEARSRSCRDTGRTTSHPDVGWLTTTVGARVEVWGRLVAQVGQSHMPHQEVVLERAAAAIAIRRLVERDQETLEQQARRSLLHDIINRSYSSREDLFARASAFGLHLHHRQLVPIVVRVWPVPEADGMRRQRLMRDVAAAVDAAAESRPEGVLVAVIAADTLGMLMSLLPRSPREQALVGLSSAVRKGLAGLDPPREAVIGVAGSVVELSEVGRGMHEAREVAEAGREGMSDRSYHELPDVHVRGLLYLLRSDPRVQAFVEREIGPLLAVEAERRRDLLQALRQYLGVGRNKSLAADALHMSRPALYHRLRSIEKLLNVELDDVEACLTLHVAIIAFDVQQRDERG